MSQEREPRRFLHRHSQFGYTDSEREALVDEPEAIPAVYQAQLTRSARGRERDRRSADWLAARGRLHRELEFLGQTFTGEIADELRVLRRTVDRLHRKLAA